MERTIHNRRPDTSHVSATGPRIHASAFVAVPCWVADAVSVAPTALQVYLILGRRSLTERKPPKGVKWIQEETDLSRSAVYEALALLRDVGALVDLGETWWLPRDDPSTPAHNPSRVTDRSSTTVERASLIENLDEETPPSPDGDTGFPEFWAEWPTRHGKKLGKAKALAVWRRLSIDDRRAAWRGARHYAAASYAGAAGAMDAFRWLRDGAWVDWQTPAEVPSNGRRSSAGATLEALRQLDMEDQRAGV